MTNRNNSNDDRESKRKQSSLRWIAFCLPVVLIVVQFTFPPVDRFHEDEVYWVGSAYYYDLAFVERDFGHKDWQLLPARENPALGKYLIGATLHATGRRIATPDILGSFYLMFANMPGAWGTNEAFEKRRQVAIRVDPTIAEQVLRGEQLPIEDSDLRTVRRLMCLIGILAAIGIIVIGWQCDRVISGLVASTLFAVHPIVVDAYSHAMIDIVAVCFSIWFIIGLIALVDAKNRSISRLSLVGAATTAALTLACGSKMNSLVVVGVAGLVVIGLAVPWKWPDPQTRWKSALAIFATCSLAAILCIVSNPSLYHDTVDGVMALSNEHRLTADIQEQILGGRLHDVGSRVSAVATLVCGSRFAMLVLIALLGNQIRLILWHGPNDRGWTLMLIALWWLVAFVMLISWIPFAWDRYALPMVAPSVLIVGISIEHLVHFILSQRTPGKSSP
ncbi:hypothetical protein [Rubripirellula reticaptiva]|uniref:Glycosyltransferase RgtA/B/C/D-like domain-containing protein n=1 Tax=Rubripirellula reticaptiva TaxID=2528013 RepID=A0A5C6FDT9_9BACT|nr:hypothetical protein [Rubripirellula reticaptiva]TWU57721.1 hypothetical protein Poly59_06290 [Rubripirellula reticaptiva]